jgi:hypothetical protein
MARGGCPFGYDKPMDPAGRERAQLIFASTHHGERRAANRPALGFVLGQTTRAQIMSQMLRRGITCRSGHGLSDLTCNAVPSAALDGGAPQAPARNLWLTFGTRQQLLSVIALSREAQPEPISAAFRRTRELLDREAGPVAQTHGNSEPRALSGGLLHQASAEFRFSDYYALARATNLGGGFLLTEEYRSLAD